MVLMKRQNIFSPEVARKMRELNLRENLFYYEILERLNLPKWDRPIQAIDIGARNFSYAPALGKILLQSSSKAYLTAIELDPFVYYWNAFRRMDCGRYYATLAEHENLGLKVQYREGDWMAEPFVSYDIALVLFPFLFEDLHLKFGLTMNSFHPERFYKKIALQSQFSVFFHQGLAEAKKSEELLKSCNTHIERAVRMRNGSFLKRKYETFAYLVRNQAQEASKTLMRD